MRHEPSKAFWPQGTFVGLQIGENTDTLRHMAGCFRAMVRAPCPPMLCPVIDRVCTSTSGQATMTASGSSWVTKEYML